MGSTLGCLGVRLGDLETLWGHFGGRSGSLWGDFDRSGDTLGALWEITRLRDTTFRANVAEPLGLCTEKRFLKHAARALHCTPMVASACLPGFPSPPSGI